MVPDFASCSLSYSDALAINTHDDSYLLSISGGVTTALVLPGSANAIGV